MYLREIAGEDYTSKDFRTWAGTVLAAQMLRDFETFDCDLTDLLAGLATGGIRPEILPEDFYPIPNLFNSHSEPSQPEG